MRKLIAISIRQPYAELIMRRKKKFEFRSRPTKKTGVVYVYAGLRPGLADDWAALRLAPGDLPAGKIIGTVEVVGCERGRNGKYAWALRSPKRISRPVAPKGKPQPVWFYPFGKPKARA